MKNFNLTLLDYFICIGLLLISILIGLFYGFMGKKHNTVKEYVLGGRNMKVIPIGASLSSTYISSITLIAVATDVYRDGAIFWYCGISMILIVIMQVKICLPVYFKLEISSVYEYLERRFDVKTRQLGSFLYGVAIFFYLPMIVYLPSLGISTATGINVFVITTTIFGICIFYTIIGGIRAVVWTDTIQLMFMITAMITVLALGIVSNGGISNIWQKSVEGQRLELLIFDPDASRVDTVWTIILGLTTNLSYICAHQAIIQKYLSLPTLQKAKRAALIFLVVFIVITTMSVWIGLSIYTKYADCDPVVAKEIIKYDQLVPYFVMDVGGHITGMRGLFVAALLSATLSTLSSDLNSIGSGVYEDFICKIWKKNQQHYPDYYMKITILVTGICINCLVFAYDKTKGTMLQLNLSLNGISYGPLVGIFFLGLLCPKINSKGAFYGGIISIISTTCVVGLTKYYEMTGYVGHTPKPVSVSGCVLSNITDFTTIAPILVDGLQSPENKPFILFRMCNFYTVLMGMIFTILPASIISYFTNKDNLVVHRDVLSPVIYCFLSKEESSTSTALCEAENQSSMLLSDKSIKKQEDLRL